MQKLNVIEHDLEEIVEDLSPEMVLSAELIQLSMDNALLAHRRHLQDSPALQQQMQQHRQQSLAALDKLQQLEHKDAGKQQLQQLQGLLQATHASQLQFEQLLASQDANAGQWLLQRLDPQTNTLVTALKQFIALQRQEMQRAEQEAITSYHQAETTQLIVGLAALLLGASIAWLFAGKLSGHLRSIVRETQRIAAGDLRPRAHPLPAAKRDETLQLAHATESMRQQLADTLGSIRQSSFAVSDASHELSSMSEQVAISVQRQAEATGEASATLEELTVSINHVSDNAEEANQRSQQAGQQAGQGVAAVQASLQLVRQVGRSVQQTGQALGELTREVQEIDRIVTVIREVADQTNLLALNASIEAARAGEAGRGFAVVADEVRKLAERTATATGDITGMIGRIRQGVHDVEHQMGQSEQQMTQADQATQGSGHTIEAAQQFSAQASQAVGSISAALGEQRDASQVLACSMEQVAQMAEENSATVEELATTSSQLSALADSMQQMVARFRLA
ncbi:methyl-accepting chemotaxis protein [Vogesella mureinivorans]|uniref:methyl-accepting chemotaxis protein n=1 Tax=Vogesella mureinivorans TaxID=657276 RepID=UPI003F6C3BF8